MIDDFLSVTQGYGDGSGDGSGYGNGSGNGYGSGNVSGFGDGFGDGSGDVSGSGDGDISASGDGYGIVFLNGCEVYRIDDIPTIIEHVHGDFARGYILERNVYLRPCYIVKGGGYFAHGETLKSAREALREKIEQDKPVEERIAEFVADFPNAEVKVDAARLFDWHHRLTGSCEMGRRTFCEDHDIDYHRGRYTVREFIGICKGEYGGKIIKQLEEQYESA